MDKDILSIQRIRGSIFFLCRDKLRFKPLGLKFPIALRIDSKYFRGDFKALETAIRRNKNIWLVLEMRNVGSIRVIFLADAFFAEPKEPEVNPSQRTRQ